MNLILQFDTQNGIDVGYSRAMIGKVVLIQPCPSVIYLTFCSHHLLMVRDAKGKLLTYLSAKSISKIDLSNK